MRYIFGMSTITLKDVPLALHRALKVRAKANGRSLNREVIAMLEGALSSVPVDASSVVQHAKAVREMSGVYVTQKDLDALKHAGRR